MLVRSDLSPGQQLAQAIHAAVELQRTVDTPPTVVVLSVKDERELLDWADRHAGWCGPFAEIDAPWYLFHEPDIDEHTALATISDGAPFSALPLAGGVAMA